VVALGDLVRGGDWIWRPKRVVREEELESAVGEQCEANDDDAPLPGIIGVDE